MAVQSVPIYSIVGRAVVHEQYVVLLLRMVFLEFEGFPDHIVLALVNAHMGTEAILRSMEFLD